MTVFNKSTSLCISLAARPGNGGTRFHNYLYGKLGLNFVYLARTTENISDAIVSLRALGIRGCGVSMPFKESCIPFLDSLEPSAEAIASVNTIVNDHGHLRGANTDYEAIRTLVLERNLPTDSSLVLHGSGGMAKATAHALADAGFTKGTIRSRNISAGEALAASCSWNFQPLDAVVEADMLINATPIGMAGGRESGDLSFPEDSIRKARLVFDVVALPAMTPLVSLAEKLGIATIRGSEVMTLQALEQFVRYTGIRPDPSLVEEAAIFSRQE